MSEGQAALPQPGDLAEAPAAQQQQEQQQRTRTWYTGYSSRNAHEDFCPGVHCTFEELEEDRTSRPRRLSNYAFCSSGTRNYEVKTDAAHLLRPRDPSLKYKFPVTDLRHITSDENAQAICQTTPKGFQGFKNENRGRCTKQEAERYNQLCIWWSVYYEQGSEPQIEAQRRATEIQEIRNKDTGAPVFLANSIKLSNPFQERLKKIPYGPESQEKKAFCYPWNDVIDAYRKQFCSGFELRFRILGTYVYRQEIMHAIVVHSSEKDHLFDGLDLVETSREGSRRRRRAEIDDQGLMYWCPESVIIINEDPYSPWEHLSFAFHVPEGEIFELPDLAGHMRNIEYEKRSKKKGTGPEVDSGPSAAADDKLVAGVSDINLNDKKE